MAIHILKKEDCGSELGVNSTFYIRAELAIDSAEDLATSCGGNVFVTGSIAWDISTGDFYGLSGDTWYKQGGSASAEPEVQGSLNAPLTLGKKTVDIEPLEDVTEEEPESTEVTDDDESV